MKDIIVELEGGLGNQLFQYARARSMQLKYGGRLLFDLHTYKTNTLRKLSLNNYNIPRDIETFEGGLFYHAYIHLLKALFFRLRYNVGDNTNSKLYKLMVYLGMYYQYKSPYFDADIRPIHRRNYLVGSWFSEKFFKENSSTIKEELKLRTPISEKSNLLLERIRAGNSVCVHIRLGDYLSPEWKDKLYVCDEDYYNKGIQYILQHVESPIFYIFTNTSKDIKWIKENYHFCHKVEFVDLSNPDYEDLFLMSSCKHHIMSNSTYSWWAQYLSDNYSKIVISPRRFNNYQLWDMKDIYMENWVLIDN